MSFFKRPYICGREQRSFSLFGKRMASQDPLDAEFVVDRVFAMQHRVVVDKAQKEDLEKEFADLKQRSPILFEKALVPMSQGDVRVLLEMMDKLKDVQNNRISQHEGSVSVGQLLVDKYIKPVVGGQAD